MPGSTPPAVLRSCATISSIGNGNFGIWAQDYNGRNLQTNVWLVENTVLNNQGGGISVQNWQAGRGNILAYDAITPLSGTSAFSEGSGTVIGNVTCSPATSCFDQTHHGAVACQWRTTDRSRCGSRATLAPIRRFHGFSAPFRR